MIMVYIVLATLVSFISNYHLYWLTCLILSTSE